MPNGKRNGKGKKQRSRPSGNRPKQGGGGGARGFLPNPSLFPAMRVGTLTYDSIVAFTPAASALSYNSYRANSVYDPDFTGVGTTAVGYTAMSSVYNRYRVLSVSVHATFTNTTATPCTAFVVASPLNTLGTNFNQIVSQRFAWYKPLNCVNSVPVVHNFKVPISVVYGASKAAVRQEDDYTAVVGTNPNNVVFLHVGVLNDTGGAVGSYGVRANLRMRFTTEWSIPLLLA